MTVSLTSPDNSKTIEQIVVNGKTYDLPPWIEEDEFIDGLKSKLISEPLAALTSCELFSWELVDFTGDNEQYPFFKVEFFIPNNNIHELAWNRFGAYPNEADSCLEYTLEEDGVKVNFIAMEPDSFDVQVYLLRKDLKKTPKISKNEEEEIQDYIEEVLESEDFEETVKDVIDWGGFYEETEVDGVPYFLLVNVHND